MGVILENEQDLVIRLYNTSLTCMNLQSKKCAVINLTLNPEMFYKTAFKEANPGSKIPEEWFEKAETVDAPKLRTTDATIEVIVDNMKLVDSEKTEAVCRAKRVEAKEVLPKAYCRALFATIEAIIHATRIKVFLHGNEKQRKQASDLMETVEIHHEVVRHAAPNSRYSQIMEDLAEMITSWRESQTESLH